MTFQRVVTVVCDSPSGVTDNRFARPRGCHIVAADQSGHTVAEAWFYTKEAGWHRNGNRTICPACWEAGAR